jgi:hypothetical protein
MPCCQVIRLPNGGMAIMCGGRRKHRPCALCGRPSTLLCDYPTGKGKTCDRALCRLCAVPQAADVDWCKSHESLPLFEDAAPRQ